MKRKIWIIVTVCLAVVLVAAACLIGWGTRQGLSISLGQYADSASGDVMYTDGSFLEDNFEVSFETVTGHMVLLDGAPVCMSGREKIFCNLTTGDRMLVIHGPVAESYPGQARAYMCIRYANGTEDDLEEHDWVNLKTDGWLSPGKPISEEEAIRIANVYTWYFFDVVTATQDSETGEWTVELGMSQDRNRHETVRISIDGTEVNILSGIIYR